MRGLAIISALALLAGPALGQTQGVLKASDALRQCLAGSGRPLGDPAQFRGGIASASNFGWTATEIAPGKHRLDRKDAAFGVTIEIQMTDPQGTAYCIAYGPAIQPGDGLAAVDRAVAQGLMPTTVTRRVEPAPPGTSRYYLAQEGPISYALTAYSAAEAGEVVGFVITGFPVAEPQPQQQQQNAAAANFALAAELCLRPGIRGPQRAQLFRQAGFAEQVSRSTGNSDTEHTFTAPGNTATAELYYGEMPEACHAESTGVGVTQASTILDGLIARLYPGYTRRITQGSGGATCVTYQQPDTPIPHVISVEPDGVEECVENGTARIFGFYAV